MNILLEKKQRKEVSIGSFTQLRTTVAVESMARSGLDYILIDSEHSSIGTEFISSAITAADAAGVAPLVRINEISRRAVLHPLDAGAKGLIVPAVETVDEVRTLIQYAKFAPLGNRGFAPTRDGKWGTDEISLQGGSAYMENANRQTLLIPQCETLGCLEHIEEITAMDGVDGIFVGPMDLSIALGHPMEMECAEVTAAKKRVLDACRKNGKLALVYANGADDAARMAELGFDSITVGLDILMILDGYRKLVEDIHEKL